MTIMSISISPIALNSNNGLVFLAGKERLDLLVTPRSLQGRGPSLALHSLLSVVLVLDKSVGMGTAAAQRMGTGDETLWESWNATANSEDSAARVRKGVWDLGVIT